MHFEMLVFWWWLFKCCLQIPHEILILMVPNFQKKRVSFYSFSGKSLWRVPQSCINFFTFKFGKNFSSIFSVHFYYLRKGFLLKWYWWSNEQRIRFLFVRSEFESRLGRKWAALIIFEFFSVICNIRSFLFNFLIIFR